ncbi:MAG: helix-turn-helix transcriptional regulator [Nakamurella sp.]
MSTTHSSYDDRIRDRRETAEFRAGYDEAKRACLIGKAAREQRLALGLTQVELASLAGMTQSALSRLEGGGAIPTIPLLDRLAAAMGKELTVAFSAAAA